MNDQEYAEKKEYVEKNTKIMYNFTKYQLKILLEGNQWLLGAIRNYEEKITHTKESDVEELNKLLKNIIPPKKKPMDIYTTLFHDMLENLDDKKLETHAQDLLILIIQILRDPSQSLTQDMREKLKVEICIATGKNLERINDMIEEETERFLDGQADASTEHLYD